MTIKVLSIPGIDRMSEGESGIHTVVRNYYKYAEQYGIEFVDKDATSYDIVAAHAGITGTECDVAHLHGIYFTGDYPATRWQHASNKNIVNATRYAKTVTVPSRWVKEIFQRDMRFSPEILPHGVDWDDWQHSEPNEGYILGYAKNRSGSDVCDPSYLTPLARKLPHLRFLSTFHPDGAPQNVEITGVIPYDEMKETTQRASVFVQAVKETFGLHALEACAAGVPVVAYNHGGVIDFVKHGINGYLAEPGNIDDLVEGINYCLQYRDKLGSNGRKIAKLYSWERAVEILSQIYQKHLQVERDSVAVVIPVYNKESSLHGAVKSALRQSRQPDKIVIIDDGSTDDSGSIGQDLANEYDIVEYYRQDNSGVAKARNNGVSKCDGIKYICCLDADDAIEPQFLDVCVNSLEQDNSIHLAYTGLQWVKPDGSTGVSKWPSKWIFDNQLKRKNQVPTCCVFRKDTFDRLGGYRSRYAPTGCGSEDAALWTQFGLHGYKCEQVTEEPLFVYSFLSGGTSQEGYHEVDWLQLYPSAHDGIHPFASYKEPINEIAHPVFMYDEPLISVVVPVGEYHVDSVGDAFDSVEAQREFRKWEIVAVLDSEDQIVPENIKKTYPYVRWFFTGGGQGPGKARNIGAQESRGKFLVFLDADDMLMPMFMKETLNAWEQSQAIIYTDYVGSAFITEEEADRQRDMGKLRAWNGPDRLSVIGYPSTEPQSDFLCEVAQSMPKIPLYHWCLVTCLIPKAWHNDIGGFDEKMESWEDVDYHWRMAWDGKCYTRVNSELVMYRFAGGIRRSKASSESEEGRQIGRNLLRYISKKKETITMSGCSGCGSQRAPKVVITKTPAVQQVVQQAEAQDQDFEFYYYQSPNKGDHRLIGANVFPNQIPGVPMIRVQGGYRIDYGYHAGSEPKPFMVHRNDVALQQTVFVKAETRREAPQVQREQVSEPEDFDITEFEPDQPNNVDPLANFANDEEKPKIAPPADFSPDDFEDDEFDLQTIPGITTGIADQLAGKTLEDLKKMSEDDFIKLKGVAEVKAEMIVQYLANLD